MLKAKWLYSELPVSLSELATLLSGEQYNDKKGYGFKLQEFNSGQLSCQYTEKLETVSIVTDPFGIESEQVVVSYYTCKFSLFADSHLMCVFDPPRSLRKFIAKLHEVLGFGFVLADITINPFDWVDSLANELGKPIITHVASSGIRTDNDGLAKISVSSRKDSRKDFNEMVSNRRHSIDTVKFKLNSERFPDTVCEMTKSGSCKINGYGNSELIQYFRVHLDQVLKRMQEV
ncbi:hypothetical protein H5123_09235 [Shewanella sp. SR43-4]|uniref:hypothetical protein n=1 Tax=Shewanella sp. SR43-4 TaxID=2760942 RepID=UPI0015F8410D|nr:hypothetical protein [Shewanella sp. SR43-4]MBB1317824.1 hypothetical protein [Shewanella sp. SR43-4]